MRAGGQPPLLLQVMSCPWLNECIGMAAWFSVNFMQATKFSSFAFAACTSTFLVACLVKLYDTDLGKRPRHKHILATVDSYAIGEEILHDGRGPGVIVRNPHGDGDGRVCVKYHSGEVHHYDNYSLATGRLKKKVKDASLPPPSVKHVPASKMQKQSVLKEIRVDFFHTLLFPCRDHISSHIIFGNVCAAVGFSFMWLLKHNGMMAAWHGGFNVINMLPGNIRGAQ